ncbi:MAG: hypothetical protein K2K60_01525 [Clostridia bacterium]|nr:hypothetical protein [Clostridia bacterium]
MKSKKLIIAVAALTMSASMAMSFGCSHKHEYTNWTQTLAPTCTEEGEETGTCPKDGATSIRKIDPLGHNYGEWQVSAPTATATGTATKVCANGDHPLVVELPALTSTEYTKSTKTPAGATKGGVDTYKLANANGEISFDVTTEARGVTTFGDVVLATVENTDKIRSGEVEVKNAVQGSYTYEYGDNYVHVNQMVVVNAINGTGYTGAEYYIDLNNDGSVAYSVIAQCADDEAKHNGNEYYVDNWNIRRPSSFSELDNVELFKNGYYKLISNTIYSYQQDAEADDYVEKTFASVEYYLQWLYEISQTKANGSVVSTWNKETGVCKLQFSYMGTVKAEKLGADGRKVYEITNKDPNGDGINYDEYAQGEENPDLPLLQYNDTPVFEDVPAMITVDVDFTIDENYVITSINSSVKNYQQRSLRVAANQPDSSEVPEYPCVYPDTKVYEEVPYFTLDGGVYVLTNDAVVKYQESYKATQVAKKTGDTVPENPYAPSKVGITDFSIYDSRYDWTGQYSLQIGPDGQPEKIYDWIKNEKITDPVNVGVTFPTSSEPLKIYIDDVAPVTAVANLNPCTLVMTDSNGKSTTLEMIGSYYEGFSGWYNYDESCIFIKNYTQIGEYTLTITIGNVTKNLKITFNPMAPTSFTAKMNSYDETKDEYTVTNATAVSVYVGETLTLFPEASGDAHCTVDAGYTTIVKDSNGDALDAAKYTVNTQVVDGVKRCTFTFTDAGEYTVTLKADKGDLSSEVAVTVSAVPTVAEILTGNLQHKASGTTATFDQDANTVTIAVDEKEATFNYTYNAETKAFALTYVSGNTELNGTVALRINLKNHVVLTYTYDTPEPLVYVLTVPSGNPVDEAYDAITSNSWSLEAQDLTFTFTKDGAVAATSSAAGTETWNYTLTDNGDGRFDITFADDGSGAFGMCGIYPDDNATGSWIKVENGIVTEFHFLYTNGWGNTTPYTLTPAE